LKASVAQARSRIRPHFKGNAPAAQEAEALREKRARQIKAQAEVEAAALLRQAVETITQGAAGLELRRMQMMTEVGAEQNTMMVVLMPSKFVDMARWVQRAEGGGVAGAKLGKRIGCDTAAAQRKWSGPMTAGAGPRAGAKLWRMIKLWRMFKIMRKNNSASAQHARSALNYCKADRFIFALKARRVRVHALIRTKPAAARGAACPRAKATKVARKRRHGAVAALMPAN